ncbi:MAG: RrF2 family transcriptional regulator [Nitrospirota bacterium]
MKFSAKGEYGVMAMFVLAMNTGRGPIQLKTIAEKQRIPIKFLEQVMSVLKKSGFIESIRGSQGGYILAKPSEKIKLGDVIQAIDGPIRPMNCVSEEKSSSCFQAEDCVFKDVWEEVKLSLLNTLNSVTLKDMCERQRKKDSQKSIMYHI